VRHLSAIVPAGKGVEAYVRWAFSACESYIMIPIAREVKTRFFAKSNILWLRMTNFAKGISS